MQERRRIVELEKRGNAAVLITLVRVEGSSYRRPGAHLLIARNGEYAGAISGGCLEAELLRKAQWLVRNGAVVERYSTLFDDTADIPYGLGCGGTVELLLEPANTPEFTALLQAMEASLRGERLRAATQLPQQGATFARCVLNAHGEAIFRSAHGPVNLAQPMFQEQLDPPQRLVIFGAGDDAQPLVRMAASLGWRIAVIDSRPQWARPDRFVEAEFVATNTEALNLNADDTIAIMTHSYEQDRAWLVETLPLAPRYLGLLGARHRSALLLSEAAPLLQWDIARVCDRVYAPMGLNLGGDGAEAIALATVAEIQACIADKLPATRRMTPELIAKQIELGGASRYLQTACAL